MIIAQLSDLHITSGGGLAYGTADTLRALESTVTHLNHLRPLPDLVTITGDIADDGEPGSYAAAATALAELDMPFYLVPGNHDNKHHLVRAFPDHTYLADALEATGDSLCFCLDHGPLRLMGLDTVTRGLHGGGLDDRRLSWLARHLDQAPGRPTLIFMHHPPFVSGIRHMDREVFVNADRLAGIVAGHPQVQCIACGHIHRSIFTVFAGIPATVCPGVGMQLLLDLSDQGPAEFIMEPPALLLHALLTDWNGVSRLFTHVSTVPGHPHDYGRGFPF